MESNDLITLVISVIGGLYICAYYLNKNKSVCCQCKKVISHQKQNRNYLEKDGEKFTLCKRCYHRETKQASLIAQRCSCCGKPFSTSMKIVEWYGQHQTYFLCASCNDQASKKVIRNFVVDDVFPTEFIKSCSSYDSFDLLAKASGLELQSQSDFCTDAWNQFVETNTCFSSWYDMKNKAEKTLIQKQNDSIVSVLMNKNV